MPYFRQKAFSPRFEWRCEGYAAFANSNGLRLRLAVSDLRLKKTFSDSLKLAVASGDD
ncbi:hypothetical protein EV673_2491 [Limnobacter thiooxidans]|nr:hypothetical protein EV673_2491 [Limnobacter thiooxidans]